MERAFVYLLAVTALYGCGGGEADTPAETTFLAGKVTTATSDVWIDHMPLIEAPGSAPVRCRPLIVSTRFVASPPPMPSDFVPQAVALRQSGKVVFTADVSKTELVRSADGSAITSIARGCEPEGLVFSDGQKPMTVVMPTTSVQTQTGLIEFATGSNTVYGGL